MKKKYYLSVDLGQTRDFTAIAGIEQTIGEFENISMYELGHLERLPLGTSYPDIVDHVVRVRRELARRGDVELIIDGTGVGIPVGDMLKKAGEKFRAIVITSGLRAMATNGAYHVPKSLLVFGLVIAYQNKRFKVLADLALKDAFERELLNFAMKVTKTGNAIYEAVLDKYHDDMVMACAMATYVGEKARLKPFLVATVVG